MNLFSKRKAVIYDAMLLIIISCNPHNRILATYVKYPLENVKFECAHAK